MKFWCTIKYILHTLKVRLLQKPNGKEHDTYKAAVDPCLFPRVPSSIIQASYLSTSIKVVVFGGHLLR